MMKKDDYESNFPFSHRGKNIVYKFHPFSKKKEIDNVLKTSNSYTLFKEHRKPKHHIPTIVHGKRFQFQADSIYMSQRKTDVELNEGNKYILAIIDSFTRYAWVFPLKNIQCKTVIKCFQKLFKNGDKPQQLYTDRGSEFKCKEFKSLMEKEGVRHFFSYSVRKCPIVERFNLTLQNLIEKKLEANKTSKWIDVLDDCMKIYLSSPHRGIAKLSPIEGEMKKNQSIIGRFDCKTKKHGKKFKPKYKKGEVVRIWRYKTKFKRGYQKNFTREYFKIFQVLKNLPGHPRYILKDVENEKIIGNFTEDEITPYIPNK